MIGLLLGLLAAVQAGDTAQPADAYVWPLDRAPVLTSSFGEFRVGRLHAGIDLRTGGIGLPVKAAGDGYISRVRCSPWGYGKGIHLQLSDGRSVVYGHLDTLEGELGEYLRTAQHAASDYTVDLSPEPGRFPVRRGKLLATSGQTGTDAPHLHFEWRDKDGAPINPWQAGMRWPDTARPELLRVAILPRGADARIDGDLAPRVLALHETAPGRYTCDAVSIVGRVSLAIAVVDPVEGARLGVHRCAARIGAREIFQIQYDQLNYARLDDGAVAYHPYLDGQFLNLFRWPDSALDAYARNADDGTFLANENGDAIEVEASDDNGNTALLSLPLARGLAPAAAKPEARRGSIDIDPGVDALVLRAEFAAEEREAPIVAIAHAGKLSQDAMTQIAPARFACWFAPEHSGEYTIRVAHPRAETFERTVYVVRRGEKAAPLSTNGLRLEVPGDAPYGVFYAWMSRAEIAPAATVPARGAAFHIWPNRAPLAEAVRLVLPIPRAEKLDGKRLGVYRWTGKSWLPLDTEVADGGLAAKTRQLGLFRVLEDTRAPRFSSFKPANGKPARGARPEISAALHDEGSGIARVEIRCDGEWLLTASDPQRDRCYWERDEDLAPGVHTLTFRATDGAGNTTEVTRTLEVSL